METEGLSPILSPIAGSGASGEGGVTGVVGSRGAGGRPVGNGELPYKEDRFVHSEVALAQVSGVAKKDLAKMRTTQLRQGVHWDLHGSEVAYTALGLIEVLQRVSGVTASRGKICGREVSDLLEKTRIGGTNGESVTAKVHRLYMNRFLIQAALPDGRLVNVRVRQNKNFRRGMELPLVWNGRAFGIQGGATPRAPGRW